MASENASTTDEHTSKPDSRRTAKDPTTVVSIAKKSVATFSARLESLAKLEGEAMQVDSSTDGEKKRKRDNMEKLGQSGEKTEGNPYTQEQGQGKLSRKKRRKEKKLLALQAESTKVNGQHNVDVKSENVEEDWKVVGKSETKGKEKPEGSSKKEKKPRHKQQGNLAWMVGKKDQLAASLSGIEVRLAETVKAVISLFV